MLYDKRLTIPKVAKDLERIEEKKTQHHIKDIKKTKEQKKINIIFSDIKELEKCIGHNQNVETKVTGNNHLWSNFNYNKSLFKWKLPKGEVFGTGKILKELVLSGTNLKEVRKKRTGLLGFETVPSRLSVE